MAARATSPELIGRVGELARLDAVLDGASANQPCLVLIAGEAGVGKSRLLTEFLGTVQARGGSVLLGACVPMAEQHLAYAPIADALRDRLDPQLLREHLTAQGQDGQPGDQAQQGGRMNLFRMFRTLVDHLGGRGPVVLAIEDMHWADASTISLLGFLHRQLRADPVIIVVTYRDDELAEHPLRDWLAEAVRLDATEHLRPPRLTRAESSAQLTAILGAPPDIDLADAIFARSAGNPLYTEMLLASPDPSTDLPDTIVELALRRVRWLSGPAQEIVRLAAVCGPRIHHALLASLADVPDGELTTALRQATEYHLLIADPTADTYTFCHPLMREAVYAHCLPSQRRAWHARIGAQLNQHPEWSVVRTPAAGRSPGPAVIAEGEIAYHALAAGDHATALQAAVRAGLAALEVSAFAEAYEQLERAAGLWDKVAEPDRPTATDKAALLAHTATAADLLGLDHQAVSWMEAAVRVADAAAEPERVALMYEQLGRYYLDSAQFEPAWEAYQQGLSLLPARAPDRARARAGIIASLAELAGCWSRHADARRYALEAIALAQAAGAVREEACARHALGMAMVRQGHAHDGLQELRSALNLYSGTADCDALLTTHIDLADCLIQVGELDEAIDVCLAGFELSGRFGRERQSGGFLLCNAAEAAIGLGRWAQAQTWLELAAACGLRGAREFPLCWQSARLAVGRGDFPTARRWLDRAQALVQPGSGPPQWARVLTTEEAELAVWQGRLDDARDAVAKGLDAISGSDEEAFAGQLLAVGLRVEADAAAWARAHRIATEVTAARSQDLLDRSKKLAPLPDQAAFAELCEAEAARALGEPATGRWREALRSWQAQHRPYIAAYTGFRLAEAMLTTRRDAMAHLPETPSGPAGRQRPDQPEAILHTARQQAYELGAHALGAEIDALARVYRLRLATPDGTACDERPAGELLNRADRLGLTPREIEVLRHVATGSSNNEIARLLYISVKTASVHVTNIMRKLNAPNRREAARTAYLLGLVKRPQQS